MSNLVKLLINLAESDEHKQQFDKDPEGLFDDSGISSEQRDALRSGDVDTITEHLNRELTELQSKIATPSAKPWSAKQTNVTGVDPTEVSTGKQDIKLTGGFFPEGDDIAVLFKSADHKVSSPAREVSGAGEEESSLVTAPTFEHSGMYVVTLENTKTGKCSDAPVPVKVS